MEIKIALALESFKARTTTLPFTFQTNPIAKKAGTRYCISADGMTSFNDFVYAFQGSKSSTLSNWSKCTIPLGNTVFKSSETVVFAACKAALFNDTETFQLVMSDPGIGPKDAKGLGRLVKGFQADVWERESRWISDLVLLIKCLWNQEVMEELLRTNGKRLCEASPRDTVWGIGAGAKNVEVALNPKRWAGRNELGNSWERVRGYLLSVLEAKSVGDVPFLVEIEKVAMFSNWFEYDNECVS
ncbi:DUF1768-domain-containing protein [Rhizoclosmatium globosum]|uniref:DUF1768-domain-containing protein n=1 Tax=Rhizoclosmatium globosum TaxID=329046 RepID=A0A1Y2CB88_9FUNG|nr:DUF1768-domain-containing protein [Rhizoclosmatium globosum]|eukprot:ORY43595.1 DUF1768-domain-containing protein [Rhizoclosmatium globosum]